METTDTIREQKRALRRLMRQESLNRSEEERLRLSLLICSQVEQHPAFVRADHVLLYHPLPIEVSTLPLVDKYSGIKQIYLPVVCGDILRVVPYTGSQALRQGAFGVMEPTAEPLDDLSRIECTVVPGVAFDSEGNRLGYGKGYYDRLLPLLSRSATLGVCFSTHYLPLLPCEPTDRKVDCVLYGE